MTFRRLLRSILGLVVSTLIFLASGEAALRVIYRDQGKATLGGPGGHGFEHLYIQNEQRGRLDTGPRRAGIERLMVIGDSVSWGLGVRDWAAVWTEQLAQALEKKKGGAVEMAVLAEPGRDMWEHYLVLQESADRVQPDVLIYQWYVNDIEVVEHRPRYRRAWQRWPQHEWARNASYLYFFLDHMASWRLPLPERSYTEYILQDFVPGRYEWTEYERAFHSFATRAGEIAKTRLLVLYPQVPFRGPYPMQPVHDRMKTLAGPHQLAIPPAGLVSIAGATETRDYYMPEGVLDVGVRLAPDTASRPAVVTVEAVDHVTNQIVGRGAAAVDAEARDGQPLKAKVDIRGTNGHSVRLRVSAPGAPALSIASIDIPVDYGFTVVDLTEPLNTFNTHASIFDAHPNERAHAVMAQEVLAALERLR